MKIRKNEDIMALFIDCHNYESINVLKARIKDGKISRVTVRSQLIDFVDYLERDEMITHEKAYSFTCPNWLY